MSDNEVIEIISAQLEAYDKYIASVESNIKQFASDLEAQEYYCLAEEALKCLEVDQ